MNSFEKMCCNTLKYRLETYFPTKVVKNSFIIKNISSYVDGFKIVEELIWVSALDKIAEIQKISDDEAKIIIKA